MTRKLSAIVAQAKRQRSQSLAQIVSFAVRKSGPMPRLQQRFVHTTGLHHAPPGLADVITQSLGTMGMLVPAARPRLRKVEFELRQGNSAQQRGGWYLPDTGDAGRIRLPATFPSAPMVTHQAFHALDMGAAPQKPRTWSTAVKDTPTHRLAIRAREIVREHLLSYVTERVQGEVQTRFPPKLARRLLTGERMPLVAVVGLLLDETGTDGDPDVIVAAIESARMPMGGLRRGHMAAKVPLNLIEPLVYLAYLGPIGIPITMYGKNTEAQLGAYLDSVSIEQRVDPMRMYLLSVHEVFARLMDQALREAALRQGLPLPASQHRLDDVPLDVFRAELEEPVWQTVRNMGWDR